MKWVCSMHMALWYRKTGWVRFYFMFDRSSLFKENWKGKCKHTWHEKSNSFWNVTNLTSKNRSHVVANVLTSLPLTMGGISTFCLYTIFFVARLYAVSSIPRESSFYSLKMGVWKSFIARNVRILGQNETACRMDDRSTRLAQLDLFLN